MSTCCGCSFSKGQAAEQVITLTTGNTGYGKIANFFVSIVTCQRNINIVKSIFYISPLAVIYTWIESNYFKQQTVKYVFKPFTTNVIFDGSDTFKKYENQTNFVAPKDSNENKIIFSNVAGSSIFAKSGTNLMIANKGQDVFHFSACSALIEESIVKNVVLNFNATEDIISFRCTKTTLHPDNVTIIHDNYNNEEITYIHVQGIERDSAVALIGNHDINISDILLNIT